MNVIQQTAREILSEAGELEAARIIAHQRVASDPVLAGQLATKAIDDALDEAWREPRKHAWPAMPKSGGETPPAASLLASMKAVGRSLMDYPVSAGRRLGDCSKVELIEWGEQMIVRGRNEMLQGTWAVNVAKLLKRNADTPRATLQEADLARMQKRAIDTVLGSGKAVAHITTSETNAQSAQPSASQSLA